MQHSKEAPRGTKVVSAEVKVCCPYQLEQERMRRAFKQSRRMSPVHRAQMLTYLKLARKHVGLLINLNVVHLKEGIERFVFGPLWFHPHMLALEER